MGADDNFEDWIKNFEREQREKFEKSGNVDLSRFSPVYNERDEQRQEETKQNFYRCFQETEEVFQKTHELLASAQEDEHSQIGKLLMLGSQLKDVSRRAGFVNVLRDSERFFFVCSNECYRFRPEDVSTLGTTLEAVETSYKNTKSELTEFYDTLEKRLAAFE